MNIYGATARSKGDVRKSCAVLKLTAENEYERRYLSFIQQKLLAGCEYWPSVEEFDATPEAIETAQMD